jgi:hypothetical protein
MGLASVLVEGLITSTRSGVPVEYRPLSEVCADYTYHWPTSKYCLRVARWPYCTFSLAFTFCHCTALFYTDPNSKYKTTAWPHYWNARLPCLRRRCNQQAHTRHADFCIVVRRNSNNQCFAYAVNWLQSVIVSGKKVTIIIIHDWKTWLV